MYTVSLIARQDHLHPQVARDLCNQWQGESLRTLSPGEAEEFDLAHLPEDFEGLRAELTTQGVDLNILARADRAKQLLLADMDSTMIEQECIDELAAEAGVGPQVADITARAMNGELDFDGALKERVGLLEGLSESVITRVLDERISLARGGRCLVATMRKHGAHASLVSGGFTAFSQEIAKRIGFNDHQANHLEVEEGILTGRVIPPILGRQAKVDALKALCKGLRITPVQALAVGDGANDLGMLHLAGMGVALHAKPAVAQQCQIRINNGDLTALLFLQGYSRDDFATA